MRLSRHEDSERQGERSPPSDGKGIPAPPVRRQRRQPQYVDGPALRYALWRRVRGRLLWISLTLGVLSISVFASVLIGAPLVHTVKARAMTGSDRDSDQRLPPAASAKEFKATFALVVGVDFTDGNQVDVLTNGDGTLDSLWSDLRAAQRSITVQMYYAGPGVAAGSAGGIGVGLECLSRRTPRALRSVRACHRYRDDKESDEVALGQVKPPAQAAQSIRTPHRRGSGTSCSAEAPDHRP